MKEPVLLAWSGGKDSALALDQLRRSGEHEVVGLLTTVTLDFDRISMHGVRRTLLEQQARAAGLPLTVVGITLAPSNAEYDARMGEALQGARAEGIRTVAFGDLYLEDVRAYREQRLAEAGMRAVFPVWGTDTMVLARHFIRRGFRATLACVDGQALDPSFAGRAFDEALLADLPPGVDPCGENGEFHTFVHDGPVFAHPVPVRPGELVQRDQRFWFRDLLPG